MGRTKQMPKGSTSKRCTSLIVDAYVVQNGPNEADVTGNHTSGSILHYDF